MAAFEILAALNHAPVDRVGGIEFNAADIIPEVFAGLWVPLPMEHVKYFVVPFGVEDVGPDRIRIIGFGK